MAFLEVVPKGKFGVKVKGAAVNLLKKYKLSALPDPSSLGKNLTAASPDLATKLTDFDGLLKKMQPLPPQGNVNWETPNWSSIAAQFGVFPPENLTKDQLTNARTLLQEKYALKIAKLVAKAEAVHAHADPNAAASNLRNFVSSLPKEVSGGVRNTIEGLIKSVINRVQSTLPSGNTDAVLKQYKNLRGDVEDEEKKRDEHLTDASVKKYAQSLNHPINEFLAPLNASAKKIQNRPNPRAQAIWDQTQVIFETMDLEWNLRSAFAKDQIKHYQKELELVDQMHEELDDTQADHLLILKPHLVDEILAKFYDMKIGEEEQELHLPSGFETLQEIEEASNAYLKEHKEFNDAEVLTTHLIDEETHAMLAAGEHH